MSKFITAFACTALFASAASAAQAESVQFSRDGYEYKAQVTQLSSGVTRIAGRELVTGKAFTLYVSGAKVTGSYGANSIAFARADAAPTQLTSR